LTAKQALLYVLGWLASTC